LGLVGAQGAEDDVGEPALEAAQRLPARLSFGAFACVVGAAFGVGADLGDGDRVERPVQLSVAAAVEPVAHGAPGGGRDRRGPIRRGEGMPGRIAANVDDLGQDPRGDEDIDRVEHQHERVVITRNGRAAAVLISPDDLDALEETLPVLTDAEALANIREADAAYARGDVTRGVEAVRRLRP
jgi:antitoxin YefM